MKLNRAPFMVKSLCLQICNAGFFCRMKIAKIFWFTVYSYVGIEFATFFVNANAKKASFISFCRFSLVLTIDCLCRVAQICKSIIATNAVNMVNVVLRPLTSHVKPRKTMSKILLWGYSYFGVSKLIYISCCVASYRLTRSRYEPSENSGMRVVVQKLFKSSLGKHLDSFIKGIERVGQGVISPFSLAASPVGILSHYYPRRLSNTVAQGLTV
jgi:hypothetical protein